MAESVITTIYQATTVLV